MREFLRQRGAIRIGLSAALVFSGVLMMERLADAQTEEADLAVIVCISKGGSLQVVHEEEPCPKNTERTRLATSAALEAALKQIEVLEQRVEGIIAAELDSSQVLASCLEVKAVAAHTITDLQTLAAEWPAELEEQLVSWIEATLSEDGSVETTEREGTLAAEELQERLKEIERLAECRRNGTESLDTQFKADDQKDHQLYELLSAVIRTLHDVLQSNYPDLGL